MFEIFLYVRTRTREHAHALTHTRTHTVRPSPRTDVCRSRSRNLSGTNNIQIHRLLDCIFWFTKGVKTHRETSQEGGYCNLEVLQYEEGETKISDSLV